MEEMLLKLRSRRCSFAIHLLSLVLEGHRGTPDMGLEEWLPEMLPSTAAPVLSQNQSFPSKFMYLLVYTPQKQFQQLVSHV